ncbi:protein FAM166B [Hippoglossus stenolepis]|uniref:protein FAM166B n=1 Tax=Hippoglossus stenolepis TaxID=195615 RepID=UPI00159C30E1|nr:protein FAM166B [Hippoglossus stenolepis]
METYAPKLSKALLTPDPHYIPGYSGYCPQLKFSMGKTYSQHTAELLSSPDVKHSSRLVLHTGHSPSTDTAALTLRSIPDGNLKKVIPGYTGFIPRSQNYFSRSFSDICFKAQAEFHQEREARNLQRSTELPLVFTSTNRQFERPKRSLTANKMVSFKPSFTPVTISPYLMDDDNQHKHFISGFTGHVPKSRFLMGKGYPIITNEALIKFGKQQRSDPTSQEILRRDSTTPPMPTIYQSKSGAVPSFTGHIPGNKFMFGHTFGQISREALERFRIERLLREKS